MLLLIHHIARNKSKNKTIFDKYNTNDLYKCFIINLIQSQVMGGIIIIPLNFCPSIRKVDMILRKSLIEKFDIIQMNIFEEQVFDDTSYTICAFHFTSHRYLSIFRTEKMQIS